MRSTRAVPHHVQQTSLGCRTNRDRALYSTTQSVQHTPQGHAISTQEDFMMGGRGGRGVCVC
jgi:hypothetical protein